jgi:uncharacterized protein with FMN-binding domain
MSKWKIGAVVVATVGGLGAVLAYSPPSTNAGGVTPAPLDTPTDAGATPAASESATESAAPTPVQSTPSQSAIPTVPTSVRPTKIKIPSARHTIAAPKQMVNGTFTGQTIQTQYGPVQVQIDVVNNKIVDARALQLPNATPNDIKLNKLAVPYLIQETIQASSADIQGVGGASYTSQGWYDSLVSALSAAGL